MSEGTFWRSVTFVLGALLGLSAAGNLSGAYEVPRQITLLLFGALAALGIGYSIVSPNSSPASTQYKDETDFRKRQYAAGIGISAVTAALFLFKTVRDSPLIWALCPIMVLPFALVVREYLVDSRGAQLPHGTSGRNGESDEQHRGN